MSNTNSERKRGIIVGLFTLLGIVFFVMAIFLLGGNQKRFSKTIALKTIFENAGGLKVGNNVFFSGVKIGTIKKIKLNNKSQVEVDFIIDDDSRQYIRKDATVKIGSEGFIGNKTLVIEGGADGVALVENNDLLQSVEAFDTEKMMTTLQTNNENMVAVTGDMKEISKKIVAGEGTVGAFLSDSLMAMQFRAVMASLTRTAANTERVTQSLNAFTNKLNTQGSLANELLTDTTVYSSLKSSAAQLQGITQTTAALVQNIEQASGKINSKDNTLGVLLNDEEMAEQMKKTMENLQQSSAKLDQNMEALQHNFLFRGYFKKQAKEAEKAAKEAEKNQ
ncbi:MlaD family protein [Olivibacter sitiensis]|uniref:MlaD family protein n=1 Tax=Olivibacter sitiensis TaxID=376470 RepID=UPI00042727BC|nr:MlaD family protein [Olivibacter sitiensis]